MKKCLLLVLIKMKTVMIFKCRWMVLMGVAVLLPLLGGCQNDELPEGEIRLNDISDNPDYQSLPLIDTRWKLIGFVDERRKKIKLAEPAEGDSYRLTFLGNGKFIGTTYVNGKSGEYDISKIDGRLTILQFGLATYAGEVYDSPLYVDSFQKVYAFIYLRKAWNFITTNKSIFCLGLQNELIANSQRPIAGSTLNRLLPIKLRHGQVCADRTKTLDHLNGSIHIFGKGVNLLLRPSSQHVFNLPSFRKVVADSES